MKFRGIPYMPKMGLRWKLGVYSASEQPRHTCIGALDT